MNGANTRAASAAWAQGVTGAPTAASRTERAGRSKVLPELVLESAVLGPHAAGRGDVHLGGPPW
jgi:hypothetical protein